MNAAALPRLSLPIDHVGYGVGNLSAALDLFSRLGFSPTPEKQLMARDPETGIYNPLGQVSAHLVFEQGYIELSAPTGAVKNNHLIPLVERYPGIHVLAIATDSAERQHQYCRQWYPDLPAVARASREIEYGKQRGTARFKWFPLPRATFSEGIVCFVEHLTRDRVFQQEVLAHPNGVVALAGVALLSRNTKTAIDRYKPFIVNRHEVPHVHENACLRLLAHDDLESDNYLQAPSGEMLIGLDLETTSLAGIRHILLEREIDFQTHEGEGISVFLPVLNSFLFFKQV